MNALNQASMADAATRAPVVSARNLRKAYKNKLALDNTAFDIAPGRIVGLIGPNGAGKTTALKAILGLIPFEGDLKVLGRDPRSERDELMNDVCFIADVAVLPRWIRVSQAIEFVAGVHPRFDRTRCDAVEIRAVRVEHDVGRVIGNCEGKTQPGR